MSTQLNLDVSVCSPAVSMYIYFQDSREYTYVSFRSVCVTPMMPCFS